MFPHARRGLVVATATVVLGGMPSQDVSAQEREATRIPLVLTGRVVDEATGGPLSAVTVMIAATGLHATTDASGRYRVDGPQHVLDRPSAVDADRPGYYPEQRYEMLGCHWLMKQQVCQVELNFWMRRMEFSHGLSAVCRVSGRVLNKSGGRGVQGVVQIDGLKIGAVSGPDGRFTLDSVASGLQRLRASSPGMTGEWKLVWVACDEASEGPTVSFRLISIPVT